MTFRMLCTLRSLRPHQASPFFGGIRSSLCLMLEQPNAWNRAALWKRLDIFTTLAYTYSCDILRLCKYIIPYIYIPYIYTPLYTIYIPYIYIPYIYHIYIPYIYTIYIYHIYIYHIYIYTIYIYTIFIPYLYHIYTIFIPYLYHIYTIFIPYLYHIYTIVYRFFTGFLTCLGSAGHGHDSTGQSMAFQVWLSHR